MKFFGAFSFVSVISIAAQASAGTVGTLPSGEGTRTKEAYIQSLYGTVNKGSALFSRTAGIEDVKGTPYGLGLSSPPGIASLTRTALSPVRPNLGSRSIQTEMLRTIFGRLLQLGGNSQDRYNSGKSIFLLFSPKVPVKPWN